MTRYYAETPCEHGEMEEHFDYDRLPNPCPGGTRTEVAIDYEAAWNHYWHGNPPMGASAKRHFFDAVDAALGLSATQEDG